MREINTLENFVSFVPDLTTRLCFCCMLQDAENKKTEKKEGVGPPLQTASVSVRALIEEKIIQKRTTGKTKEITITDSYCDCIMMCLHINSRRQ